MNSVSNLDALDFLEGIESNSVQLVWTDPPFGTGAMRRHTSTWAADRGYEYLDPEASETLALIERVSQRVYEILKPDGVFALLLDYRLIHEAVTAIKRAEFLTFRGEIIYHFELGGVTRSWWTNKHNTIALFTKGEKTGRFDLDAVPHTIRKAGRGDYQSETRRVNSVWTYTMGPSDRERVGYPTQKPLTIVEPFVLVHTQPGDLCVDPFCGSGTLGVAASRNGRSYLLNDSNPEACEIARRRVGE